MNKRHSLRFRAVGTQRRTLNGRGHLRFLRAGGLLVVAWRDGPRGARMIAPARIPTAALRVGAMFVSGLCGDGGQPASAPIFRQSLASSPCEVGRDEIAGDAVLSVEASGFSRSANASSAEEPAIARSLFHSTLKPSGIATAVDGRSWGSTALCGLVSERSSRAGFTGAVSGEAGSPVC